MKIAIIGGGPAGSFTSHFLVKFAKEKNIDVMIDIYDYKSFPSSGKRNCNMCAGIISASLVRKLELEKIFIPQPVIKNEILGYHLHTDFNTVFFRTYSDSKIYAVFRSGGPPLPDQRSDSFDQFLLDHARKNANVFVLKKRVEEIGFHTSFIEIKTDDGLLTRYDFAVGAFGVNSPLKHEIKTGYIPPETIKFRQFEMSFDEAFVRDTYRGRVHMFPVYKSGIWFITLTPKNNFVTVTAAGNNVDLQTLKSVMLSMPAMQPYIPVKSIDVKCTCMPEIPVSIARNSYTDRYLTVGDAFISRYLKNGIESAYQTALFASETIINFGIGKREIKKRFVNRCERKYIFDNFCGRILFKMNRLAFLNPIFTAAHTLVAKKEQLGSSSKRLSNVFWDMFTGDKPYAAILRDALHPALIVSILTQFFARSILFLFKGREALRLKSSSLLKLLNNGTVAVIGGGPSGASCAIKLARLANEKNMSLRIVLFEGKDFTHHHNQCVGVLSPPLLDIMEKELGIVLPQSLIKSEIPGYELITDSESIFLQNYRKERWQTFSTRRAELDNYLLDCVRKSGVEVVSSRVTHIEFRKDAARNAVRIFSESSFLEADMVVGAFGLDMEMLSGLSEATGGRFQPPKKIMKTFLTRIDLQPSILNELYDSRVFAFLSSKVRGIEFGAVTVKDDHLVVNIAGNNIHSANLSRFLDLDNVKRIIPELDPDKIRIYYGLYPSGPSRCPYGDRYVTVGDATGWLRPLKGKGINLAVITGINAARTMIEHGISKKDLKNYRKLCREFISDYKYGCITRWLLKILVGTTLLDVVIRRAKKSSRFYKLLYDAVSAEESYRNMLYNFLHPRKP